MKAPPRPLSQKRAAEGLQGRVRRARLYVLSQAAGAAALYHLPLRTTSLLLEGEGFKGHFRALRQRTLNGVFVRTEAFLEQLFFFILLIFWQKLYFLGRHEQSRLRQRDSRPGREVTALRSD